MENAIYIETHQVQGVLVCEKHECLLKPYIVEAKIQEYINLNEGNMDFKTEYPNNYMRNKLTRVAQDVYFLLNNNYKDFYIDDIKDKYNYLLYKRGLSNINGRVNQKLLHKKFIDYYDINFLNNLESYIYEEDEFNWLRCITRKYKKSIHPIRNILFIDFLCGSVEKFINEIENTSDINGPWLCLNPCCINYKKPVINDYTIRIDSKVKKVIGTFECECGFIYSRNMERGLEDIGRIKCYGSVWEQKLKELINSSHLSISAIAKEMKCDDTTVVKYAEKLGIKHLLNTKRGTLLKETNKINFKSNFKIEYRNKVQVLISLESSISRNELRKKLSKEYMWLYRNDKEWFDDNMPKLNKNVTNNKDYTEYWIKKDEDTLALVKDAYNKILSMNEPIRITKSLIGRKILKKALLEKKIYKLPETKKFLELICSSVEQFRFIRLDRVYKYINEVEIEMPVWKILRMAGIKDKSIVQKYNLYKSK